MNEIWRGRGVKGELRCEGEAEVSSSPVIMLCSGPLSSRQGLWVALKPPMCAPNAIPICEAHPSEETGPGKDVCFCFLAAAPMVVGWGGETLISCLWPLGIDPAT